MKVKVLFLEFCNSEIQLAVSAKLGMDGNPLFVMDKSVITCMFGIKLDLIKAMSGMAAKEPRNNGYNTPGDPNAPNSSQINSKIDKLKETIGLKVDENAIYVQHLKIAPIINAVYTPARALLPNIIGGHEDDLANYDVTQQITVKDNIKGEVAQGQIHLKMEKWEEHYQSPHLKDIDFNDTALMSVSSRNFGGINTIRVFIPVNNQIRISRDPIAILSISAKVKLLDVLGLGQTKAQVHHIMNQAKAEGGLITNIVAMLMDDYINLKITLMDQEGIREIQKGDIRDTMSEVL